MVRKIPSLQKMSDDDARELFIMLMQGSAADWMTALLKESYTNPSLDRLTDSFKEHYCKAKELLWQQASQIWREKQGPQEKVLEYVVRMKKLARELNFQPEIIKTIILQGFRPGIKAAVIQTGETDMEEMIHVAKLAESVEVASNDAVTEKLFEMMKASVEASQKQATELQTLAEKVATISSNKREEERHNFTRQERTQNTQSDDNRTPRPRILKPTPRNHQRINYVRRSNNMQAAPSRSFRPPTRETALLACYSTV
jgi:hypothetical protein